MARGGARQVVSSETKQGQMAQLGAVVQFQGGLAKLVLVGVEILATWRPEGRGGRKEVAEGGFWAAQASQDPVRFGASIWF